MLALRLLAALALLLTAQANGGTPWYSNVGCERNMHDYRCLQLNPNISCAAGSPSGAAFTFRAATAFTTPASAATVGAMSFVFENIQVPNLSLTYARLWILSRCLLHLAVDRVQICTQSSAYVDRSAPVTLSECVQSNLACLAPTHLARVCSCTNVGTLTIGDGVSFRGRLCA